MFISTGDITTHVLIDGPPGAPPLVLLHSLGTNAHVWDVQAVELAQAFRVIRPDLRGHGLTSCTAGPYTAELFSGDLAGLLDALDVGQAHIAGISLGGLIAQAFAAASPERVASLILVDTAMVFPLAQAWAERAAQVRARGVGAIADDVIARWVMPAFGDKARREGLRAMLLRTPAEGYAASAEAVAAADCLEATARIEAPTLIIVGNEDQATPVAAARALHEAIKGSVLVVIENAAHIPLVEQAAEVTRAILEFLRPEVRDYYETGMAVRREVAGEAHVALATAAITDLDRDFQAFITRTAWGSVWARPGLDRRTRSLLTIAMLASLGHVEELKMHFRASKNTGATPAEIAETLMQVGVYAGIPAANSAFRTAKEIFKEIEP